MTEIELLIDFHQAADRLGPGSTEDTLKALSFIGLIRQQPLKVADIGCGTGASTITLAQNLAAHITAVDLFPQFLRKLNQKSSQLGLQNRIKTLEASMQNLPFAREEFDIIWSEGAIYLMGFAEGIRQWKDHLTPGGYLAVSEITWLTYTRPAAIEQHWLAEYPEIGTASEKIKILEENGFTPAGYFILPPESWMQNYYQPMEKRLEDFLARHNHAEMAVKLVEAEKEEIRKYQQYQDYYSYGFYVARKIEK